MTSPYETPPAAAAETPIDDDSIRSAAAEGIAAFIDLAQRGSDLGVEGIQSRLQADLNTARLNGRVAEEIFNLVYSSPDTGKLARAFVGGAMALAAAIQSLDQETGRAQDPSAPINPVYWPSYPT